MFAGCWLLVVPYGKFRYAVALLQLTETQTNIPRKDIVPYTRYNQHTVLVSEERRMILTMMTPRSGMMMMKTTKMMTKRGRNPLSRLMISSFSLC